MYEKSVVFHTDPSGVTLSILDNFLFIIPVSEIIY